MKTRVMVAVLAASAGTLALGTDALACGGCFHAPTPVVETTAVTGHRMAFAISSDRTVLWDQIQYAGAPEDFSWVLPVRPGSYVEASTDAWFEALDAITATRVSAPPLRCASSTPSGGCGCGSAMDSAALGAGPAEEGGSGGVNVIHAGTVGPYATVTLESKSGDTLTTWLGDHGYTVPSDIAPIISAYVDEGFDFIALRLAPNKGVQQMTPVRVVTPGPEGPLPLRMVAAGIGESVAITLYVIGQARFALPDLTESFIDETELKWDYSKAQSNYLDLREEALAWFIGYRYLTTFAERAAFSKTFTDPDGNVLTTVANGRPHTTLASTYFAQAQVDASQFGPDCPDVTQSLLAPGVVGEDIPAAALACNGFDDISAALLGMEPSQVWLNRLEMNLPRAALSSDCVVAPNESQQEVSQFIRAVKRENLPASCPEPVFESTFVSERGLFAWLIMAGLGVAARVRRRSRR
jgi:hypothetical protein